VGGAFRSGLATCASYFFAPRVLRKENEMTDLANARGAFIGVRVPQKVVDQLDRLAERELISRSDFVRRELYLICRAADREPVPA